MMFWLLVLAAVIGLVLYKRKTSVYRPTPNSGPRRPNQEALRQTVLAAERGDRVSQNQLEGWRDADIVSFVECQEILKENLYSPAANAGDLKAQLWMAHYFEYYEKNRDSLRYWLEKAAAQNDTTAMMKLSEGFSDWKNGSMPEVAFGVDEEKENELIDRAAALGSTDALCEQGSQYTYGRRGKADTYKAAELFEQAGRRGDANGYVKLGDLYLTKLWAKNGNYEENECATPENAQTMYRKALECAESESQAAGAAYGLGRVYAGDLMRNGMHFAGQNAVEAMKWFYISFAVFRGNSGEYEFDELKNGGAVFTAEMAEECRRQGAEILR